MLHQQMLGSAWNLQQCKRSIYSCPKTTDQDTDGRFVVVSHHLHAHHQLSVRIFTTVLIIYNLQLFACQLQYGWNQQQGNVISHNFFLEHSMNERVVHRVTRQFSPPKIRVNRGNGEKMCSITAVLGSVDAVITWRW